MIAWTSDLMNFYKLRYVLKHHKKKNIYLVIKWIFTKITFILKLSCLIPERVFVFGLFIQNFLRQLLIFFSIYLDYFLFLFRSCLTNILSIVMINRRGVILVYVLRLLEVDTCKMFLWLGMFIDVITAYVLPTNAFTALMFYFSNLVRFPMAWEVSLVLE